jgi:hypothetical protein
MHEFLSPHLDRGGEAVILAEEWLVWTANNVFGFDRIVLGYR